MNGWLLIGAGVLLLVIVCAALVVVATMCSSRLSRREEEVDGITRVDVAWRDGHAPVVRERTNGSGDGVVYSDSSTR